MPGNVILHTEPVFVELVFAGSVLRHDMEMAAIRALEACERAATSRLLCDCTELAGGHSVGELYFVAERLSAMPMAVAVREAVVLPALPVARPDAHFWETTANNRGMQVQVFPDRQSALDWLMPEA